MRFPKPRLRYPNIMLDIAMREPGLEPGRREAADPKSDPHFYKESDAIQPESCTGLQPIAPDSSGHITPGVTRSPKRKRPHYRARICWTCPERFRPTNPTQKYCRRCRRLKRVGNAKNHVPPRKWPARFVCRGAA